MLSCNRGQLNRCTRDPKSASQKPRVRTRTISNVMTPSASKVATIPKDPFAEKTIYNDSFLELAFIKLYTQKMIDRVPGLEMEHISGYDDFVTVSKEIMKGRSPLEQQMLVRQVLFSLMPDNMPQVFRKIFPPNQSSHEINAFIASLGFKWLVGEMELKKDTLKVSPTEQREQRSVVLIKKCRYLEASGCVGLCTNLCKIPTQSFFTDDCGLALNMVPNFEDLSCEMRFGEPPPPIEEDDAFKQPCFQFTCPTSSNLPACPKLASPASDN